MNGMATHAPQVTGTFEKPLHVKGISKEIVSISLFILILSVLAMIAMDFIVVPEARGGITERYWVVIDTIKSEGLWLIILGLVFLMVVTHVVENEFNDSN